MNYWYMTQDMDFLAEVAPILYGIADYQVSRVSLDVNKGDFIIAGVVPINEWAANNSTVWTYGVTNSVETNAIALVSIRAAILAAKMLNVQPGATWDLVANNLRIPYDAVLDMYLEYDNFVFENPVCPVETVLLGYPLQIINSQTTLRNTMEFYSPEPFKTCDENPGMTECIHLANWLDLEEFDDAQFAFNRSKHAACYGPFNVRNEVDLFGHGGIFINSHFLTGDGGFLQAMLNGWGGIRINNGGLRLNPFLPANVAKIVFSKIHYLQNDIRITFDQVSLKLELLQANPKIKLVVTLQNGNMAPLISNMTIARNDAFMPAIIAPSN